MDDELFEEPLPPISKPEKKKRPRKMKAVGCDCYVEHEPQFEDLSLYTQRCEFHEKVFLMVGLMAQGTITTNNEAVFQMQDAWRDYIWKNGQVLYYWEDDDEPER